MGGDGREEPAFDQLSDHIPNHIEHEQEAYPQYGGHQVGWQREPDFGYGRYRPEVVPARWLQRSAPYNDGRYGRSHRGLSLREAMARPRRERLGDPFMLGDVGNFDGSGDVLRASRRNTMDENWQRSADTQHYISDQRGADTRGHGGRGNNTGQVYRGLQLIFRRDLEESSRGL